MMASSTVNEMSNSNSNMKEFSKEIHIAIASFLGVNDVVNYQSCNKQLRRMINLHRLNKPSRIDFIRSELQMYQGVDRKLRMEKIIGSSFYFSNLIHSVKLSCSYQYQGRGNRKGQIYISEKPYKEQQQSEKDQEQQNSRRCFSLWQVDDDDESDDDDDEIDDEEDARHETKYESIFRPKPGFMYYLSYPMLGHTRYVRHIKLESFVHSACIPLANILMDAPTSHQSRTSQQSLFDRNMLQHVLDTVQQQEILVGRPSLSFFQSVGLDLMDEHDVEAVRMLLVELDSN